MRGSSGDIRSISVLLFVFVVLLAVVVGASRFLAFRSGRPAVTRRETPPVGRPVATPTSEIAVRIPVLMYHYVEYVADKRDTIRQSLDTQPHVLEAQIATLHGAGYQFLTAADAVPIIRGTASAPAKSVVLTFDDGYRDFYTDVFPILKKYGVKATVYVISGFLDRPNYLTRAQLREIAASDLVDIGGHTVHHPSLAGAPHDVVIREVTDCKTSLETETGKTIVSFAYPYGRQDASAKAAVASAGFQSAVITAPGFASRSSDMFALPRLRAGSRTGKALLSFLE